MNLEEFLKGEFQKYLDSLERGDVSSSSKTKQASDETSSLLDKNSSDSSEKEKKELVSVGDNVVSLDIDVFPSDEEAELGDDYNDALSSTNPQTQTTTSVNSSQQGGTQTQNISMQSSAPPRSYAQPVQVIQQTIDKSDLRIVVEKELEERLKNLNISQPNKASLVSSPHFDEILRLKNELVDLKTIIQQLQQEQSAQQQEQKQTEREVEKQSAQMKAELQSLLQEKENELLKQESIHNDSLKHEPIKQEPLKRELIQQKSIQNDSVQQDSEHQSSVSSELANKPSYKVSQPQQNPTTKDIPQTISQANKQSSSIQSSSFSSSSTSSFPKSTLSKKFSSLPSLKLPPRSKELPEVLFIEERLFELNKQLSAKNYNDAKIIYEDVLRRAKQLRHHDQEKKIIYQQLKNAATILSFALKGEISTKVKGKHFVNTSPEPALLVGEVDDRFLNEEVNGSSEEQQAHYLNDASLQEYLSALEALHNKEKAKALQLLIGLVDQHPHHLGLKLRLRQALEL